MKKVIDFTDESLYVDWYSELTDALYDPTIRYVFLKWGAGAWKSYLVGQVLVQNILDWVRIAAFRKVRSSLRASCFQLMKDIALWRDLEEDIDIRESLSLRSFHNEWFCNMFWLDDPEKIKSIAGIDRIRVEEATELTYEDFGQLDLRLRWWHNHKLILSFNPVSEKHRLKTEIKDKPSKRPWSVWIEKTAWDNKFVGAEYLQRLAKLKDTNPSMYRVYSQNKWWQWVKGQIYTGCSSFDRDISPHIMGLDFGFNHPTALVYLNFVDDSEKTKLYIQEKLYKTHLTWPLIVEEFEKLKVPKNILIVADNARPELIQQIGNAWYKIIACEKWKWSIQDWISKVQEFDLHINGVNLEKESSSYVRKLDKNGKSLEVPVDDWNHCFKKWTKVITEVGVKNIESIEAWERVLTSAGFNMVLSSGITGYSEIFNYTLQSDTLSLQIACTKNHLFYTSRWRQRIDQLKLNDVVYLHRDFYEKNTSYTVERNTSADEERDYTLWCGSTIIEKLKSDFISIIKIITPKTIIQKTLNALKEVSIYQFTVKWELKKIQTIIKSCLQWGREKQECGTSQKNEGNGIVNMLGELTKKGNHLKSVALLAHLLTKIGIGPKLPSSALTNVNQSIEGKNELTMLKESVYAVNQSFHAISTQKLKHVLPFVLADIGFESLGNGYTYDLTIENTPDFFANWFLVHNCRDWVRYWVMEKYGKPQEWDYSVLLKAMKWQ